jgi:hypothetical protein
MSALSPHPFRTSAQLAGEPLYLWPHDGVAQPAFDYPYDKLCFGAAP